MNRRSAKQQKTRQSFFGHLLRSHMYVAAIGVFSLLIALATLFVQARNTQLLSQKAIPISQASSTVLVGVQNSLATMRGWVSLNDKRFAHEWRAVWAEEIDPAFKELGQLALIMNLPGAKKRISELSLLLTELKESQWWVFEIAQTPGNEPAKVMYQMEIDPILFTLDKIIRSLFDSNEETLSATLHNAERNSLHEAGIFYYSTREILQKIIFRGDIILEDNFLYNLSMLKDAAFNMSQIDSGSERFNILIKHLKMELIALERLSRKTIDIRKSNNWNVSRHLMETETVPLAKKIIKVMNRVDRDTDEIVTRQANLTTRRGYIAAIGLSALLAVIIVAAFSFSRSRASALSRPVIALATAARQMSEGTLTEDIVSARNDELGDLTHSFNIMRKDLQESQLKMLRQEKMAAIGQLSGSVAHDIRNPLGAITNSIFFLHLITNEETDEKIREHLSLMEHEINRANGIINDLLDFSRENVPNFVQGNLNIPLEQLVSGVEFAKEVTIDLQLDEDLPLIAFDFSQLSRVVSNLLINASQAMPDGGTLQVRTGHDDEYVWIVISDTGHGISEENMKKIFDPLFTTKASGVGLGLSIVKDFIEKHHGTLEVESAVGKGTTFTARLPIYQDEV